MTIGEGSPITVPSGVNQLQNFSDATAGRSLQLYYGVAMTTSTSTIFGLTRDVGLSDPASTLVPVAQSGQEFNFDITINKPTILAGLGYVDVKHSGNAQDAQIKVELYHYNGITETLISDSPLTENHGVAGAYSSKIPLNISKKLYGVGSTLRLKLTITLSTGSSNTSLMHDPQTAGNELKMWVPIVNLE